MAASARSSVLAFIAASCHPAAAARAPALSSGESAGWVSSTVKAVEPEIQAASMRSLDVPGFESAVLYTPTGSGPRPLLVAAHGAGGSPEWECEYWRRLTNGFAFLLCLRGTALGGSYGGYFFRDHRALEKELVAAERVARSNEPRIALGSAVYAGFSQGASMASAMIAQHAGEFPFLVLIEGFELWNVPRARTFARAGGRRILFACGSKECAKVAEASVRWLGVAGVEAKLEYASGTGHSPLGEVMTRIASSLPWLLGGNECWRP